VATVSGLRVVVELDAAPREIAVPDDLAAALAAAPTAGTAFGWRT